MRTQLDSVHSKILAGVSEFAATHGFHAWATGGFLRDSILGRPIQDIDITIDADPLVVGPDLAAPLRAHLVVLDAGRGHVRLVLRRSGEWVDLMPLRAPNIDSDLRLRDYTINALATPAEGLAAEFDVLDPTGGLADLDTRTLRVTAESCLVDDPLRLLRGVRLATQLGFTIERVTASAIRRLATSIAEAAPERQREELVRIFASDRAAQGVRQLDDLGLLRHIVPELEVTRGVSQPKEHFYDVFDHGIAAVEYMDVLLVRKEACVPDYKPIAEPAGLWRGLREGLSDWPAVERHLDTPITRESDRRAIIKLCALLHDIGKPDTKCFEASGRMRFFGHSEAGAKLAGRLMRRLRFPSREVRHVRAMIEAHLRPIQMAQDGLPSKRAVYKLFRDTGDAGVDTLLLSLADHLATSGPRGSYTAFRRHVSLIDYVLRTLSEQRDRVKPSPLITGRDVMSELGLDPGPELGRLLARVKQAHATGEVTTRREALDLGRRLLEGKPRAVAE